MDRKSGSPVNFGTVGRSFVPHFFSGQTNAHRGICAGGPDGDLYVIHARNPHENHAGQVSRIGMDGRVKDYGIVDMDTTINGVKADRHGNIYVGCTARPGNCLLPAEIDSKLPQKAKDMYRWFYGSIVKFGPTGGRLRFNSQAAAYVACKMGEDDGLVPCKIDGAVWVHPDYSPIIGKARGKATRCTCNSNRFELDDNGRLFMPDGVQGRVEVLDSNGNTIAFIGKRGVNQAAIEFRWPTMVAASDEFCYVLDFGPEKAFQIQLDYELTEECTFTK